MRRCLSPQQMNEWKAFRKLQPATLERIADILKIGFWRLANAFGAECELNDFEPYEEKKDPEPEVGPAQAAQITAMTLGPPDGNRNR